MARFGFVEQYFDNAGDPLSGGKLYFYESGTSTPLTTYSDASMLVPNTNPVVLDAAGRSGDVFFSDAAKVVVTDASDVTIDTVDPVGGGSLSASDVATLYESNSDTNKYTDAEKTKLAGIEALADVTDEANVISALDGATLTAVTPVSSDKLLMLDVSDSSNLKTATVGDVAATQDWSGFLSLASGEHIGITADFITQGNSAFNAVYLIGGVIAGKVDDSGPGTSYITGDDFIGVALESGSNGQTIQVLLHGFVANTGWSFTRGAVVYATTSGALTETRPASDPQIIVGHAVDTDTIYVGGPWNSSS